MPVEIDTPNEAERIQPVRLDKLRLVSGKDCLGGMQASLPTRPTILPDAVLERV